MKSVIIAVAIAAIATVANARDLTAKQKDAIEQFNKVCNSTMVKSDKLQNACAAAKLLQANKIEVTAVKYPTAEVKILFANMK